MIWYLLAWLLPNSACDLNPRFCSSDISTFKLKFTWANFLSPVPFCCPSSPCLHFQECLDGNCARAHPRHLEFHSRFMTKCMEDLLDSRPRLNMENKLQFGLTYIIQELQRAAQTVALEGRMARVGSQCLCTNGCPLITPLFLVKQSSIATTPLTSP